MGRAGPDVIGLVCAIVGTGLGLAHLALAGAPHSHLALNSAALIVGLVAHFALRSQSRRVRDATGRVLLACGAILLVTALAGESIDGARRWLRIGPVVLQPGLVLVPAMLVAFASRVSRAATLALVVAAGALALQPDRAMAAVLASGLLVHAALERSRAVFIALVGAVIAFAVTIARPDDVAPAAYVEGVFRSAFDAHVVAGVCVVTGVAVLLAPAVVGATNAVRRKPYAVFGAAWLGVFTAAWLGDYPTAVLGYGASGVLGYFLSIALLPGRDAVPAGSSGDGSRGTG